MSPREADYWPVDEGDDGPDWDDIPRRPVCPECLFLCRMGARSCGHCGFHFDDDPLDLESGDAERNMERILESET